MLEIYYLDVQNITASDYKKMCAVLTAERVRKAENYAFKMDRFLSAAAGYLLHIALKKHGVDMVDSIIYGPHGKPYLEGDKLFFNLAHSGTVAACALSDCEVGVDVECLFDRDEKLLGKICTEGERAFLSKFGGQERRELITRLWVAKESYLKFLGTGLSVAPAELEVNIGHDIVISRKGVHCAATFTEFNKNDYKLTVCTAREKCINEPIEVQIK